MDDRPGTLEVSAFTATSAAGRGVGAILESLLHERSGLVPNTRVAGLDTWLGKVRGLDAVRLRAELSAFDCRNNRLAVLGLGSDGFEAVVAAAAQRHGASRVGVFLGTSTSGIRATEEAYTRRGDDGSLPPDFSYRHTHDAFSFVDLVRRHLGLSGPASAVSTACSSSAKVFAVGQRHIQAGLCDAAVVGGVDSLCRTTLFGFNALELLDTRPCRPWAADRAGLSLGEAAGFALLERAVPGSGHPRLLGYGESNDAYHMSAPHPDGLGARLAMEAALRHAALRPRDVDYVNLHGTATRANDRAEARALNAVLVPGTPCSSTKGLTGHTLGAAGIVEAVICLLALGEGCIPGTLNTAHPDPELGADLVLASQRRPLARVMSNSFGFGGDNVTLLFGLPA